MILTDQEKKMLDGEEGYPAQKAICRSSFDWAKSTTPIA